MMTTIQPAAVATKNTVAETVLERNVSLDILKLAMAFMVIAVHAEFLGDVSELGRQLTVNGIFRMAVPTFFVINGFYFYPVLSKSAQFEWLKRVFVLYAFWMIFYSWYWFQMPASMGDVVKFIRTLIVGFWHLWYLAGLLGAALVLVLFKKRSSLFLLAFGMAMFCVGIAIQYTGHYHLVHNPKIDHFFNIDWSHRNFLLFSFPFFCVGFLINKHSIQQKISNNTALVLALFGLALLIAESYINFRIPSEIKYFDNFAAFMVACPAVFIFLTKQHIAGYSKNISLYSSAIYYIHAAILIVLIQHMPTGTLLAAVAIALSIPAAFLVIKINEKLKFIL